MTPYLLSVAESLMARVDAWKEEGSDPGPLMMAVWIGEANAVLKQVTRDAV